MADYADMHVDELREQAKSLGLPGIWDMTKTELVETLRGRAGGSEGRSTGTPSGSRPVEGDHKYEQQVSSPDEHEERPGRSLVTTDHEVIRRWAEARGAKPATVPGTEHGDHLGVLRFDFPGYGGQDLREVSWEEWFATFDERRLNFIYQEHRTGGSESNFFRLDNPDREDA